MRCEAASTSVNPAGRRRRVVHRSQSAAQSATQSIRQHICERMRARTFNRLIIRARCVRHSECVNYRAEHVCGKCVSMCDTQQV